MGKFDLENRVRLLSEERFHTAGANGHLAYSLDQDLGGGQRAFPLREG